MPIGSAEPLEAIRPPGHSGGAVPELHRSSLFARRISRCRGPPGVRMRSVCRDRRLSTQRADKPEPPVVIRQNKHPNRQSQCDRQTAWGSLPTGPIRPSHCAACNAAGCTTVAAVSTGRIPPERTAKLLAKKYLGPTQALFPRPPIAPVSPGASLCPSGNQRGRQQPEFIESRNGSTGLPQKSSWITPSG